MYFQKSLFPLFISFFTGLACVQAQKFSVGISAGPARSDLRSGFKFIDAGDIYKPALGFFAGANLNYHVSKQISLGTGFEFEQIGAQLDLFFTDENGEELPNVEATQHLDFISIPLFLELNTGSKIKGVFRIGQSLSYYAGGTIGFKYVDFIPNYQLPELKSFNYTLTASAGIQIPLTGKLAFQTVLRGSYGIANISDEEAIEIRTIAGSINLGLQLQL